MTVWRDVAGQERVVAVLGAAVHAAQAVTAGDAQATAHAAPDGGAMTHAWLLTGPPGSGRSVAARAFAAALQCPSGGCGECPACRTVLGGTHADVEMFSTDLLSLGVADTRELVRRAALSPAGGRWQVIIVEDADRLTERAANALLKALEEPAPRTVWILCAPSAEDVLPTIRSRARVLHLVTPAAAAVAEVLVRRDGIEPAQAELAARAAQGHIGRARRLATDPAAWQRRVEVLALPEQLGSAADCLAAAHRLVEAVKAEVTAVGADTDAAEREALKATLGVGAGRGGRPPEAAPALKELEARQKKRTTRAQRDGLDRALVDLVGFYRDVLAVQVGATVPAVHADRAAAAAAAAAGSAPEGTLRRIEAVLAARVALEAAAAPLLTIEAMTLALRS